MNKLLCIAAIMLTTIPFSFAQRNKRMNQQQIMDSWVGGTKQEIILEWGPPDKIFNNSPDGQILIYAKEVYIPNYSGRAIDFWQYKYIYVNNEGQIYSWKIENKQVPPQQMDIYIR